VCADNRYEHSKYEEINNFKSINSGSVAKQQGTHVEIQKGHHSEDERDLLVAEGEVSYILNADNHRKENREGDHNSVIAHVLRNAHFCDGKEELLDRQGRL